ncbi:MAG TPA: hypothetical protein VMZ03_14400, partial [Chitinophagaceae bacterium]|nr:hypothetical protein [Chitinophagaceae bacterium]
MTDHILYKDNETIDSDKALVMLTGICPELNDQWNSYKKREYQNYSTERLDYVDIGVIINYIVEKKKRNQVENFKS